REQVMCAQAHDVSGDSRPGDRQCAGRFLGIARLLAFGFGFLALFTGTARSQDEVRNFKKPILTVETGGHHSRVRSLIWQDGFTRVSGGEDKVVKVWTLRDGARLPRTIRPPIWRGPAGMIYSMALSKPDKEDQSFLAVGGFGVENRRGDLTVFRVPGLDP